MLAGAMPLLPALANATEPPPLSHNPFSRPSSTVNLAEAGLAGNRDGAELTPELKATMVGSHDRLANVGGRILRPGDESQGYTLVEVYEDRAIFSRQGKIMTVYVKIHPVTQDE
jgi:hypothetical protein